MHGLFLRSGWFSDMDFSRLVQTHNWDPATKRSGMQEWQPGPEEESGC